MSRREGNDPDRVFAAARGGKTSIVLRAIRSGFDLESVDRYGRTLLAAAAEHGHVGLVRLLLEKGSNPNATSPSAGDTALILAARLSPNARVIDCIVRYGGDVNARGSGGHTPLIAACSVGRAANAARLIDYSADVNAQNESGETALTYASCYGHYAIVKMLVDAGADVNLATACGGTALMSAASQRHYRIVVFLLRRGADPDRVNRRGDTALILSVRRGNDRVVKGIAAATKHIGHRNNDGYNALDVASRLHPETIAALLREGRITGRGSFPADTDNEL